MGSIDGLLAAGVVSQKNALWDRLSVKDHLYLFARIRGVPESEVKTVIFPELIFVVQFLTLRMCNDVQLVESIIDQLELAPYRDQVSMTLPGGVARKLCVGIALIGDPKVVLLDEPSAGEGVVAYHNY